MSGGPRVATVTFSDTRTDANDEGGKLLRERLAGAGCALAEHAIVREDRVAMRAALEELLSRGDLDAVVTTGGTGLAPRDVTVEAVRPLLDKEMEGFGEAFRRLSWEQVGARSILSRALAGVARGKVIACLPGSTKALALAVDQLLSPILAHAVDLASGRNTGHPPPQPSAPPIGGGPRSPSASRGEGGET